MIYQKIWGRPFDTESVVGTFVPDVDELPYLSKGEQSVFTYQMDSQDILYGLGENVRGINKRGWIYESKCRDDNMHTEDKRALYGAYNFLIVSGRNAFGIYVDYPGIVVFDCGYTDRDVLQITIPEPNFALYIIEGGSLLDIVKQFRQLVGRSYIPPKWAFGNGQSRWSYRNEDEVRRVADQYQENGIPLDAIYLDIDYMERFKDFTINTESFPDFAGFAAEMKERGVHLVPIIDAGVKIEEGYEVYEEGLEKGYFCKRADGTPFVAGVWPGRVHFPDVLNEEARRWFGDHYKFLLDQGIDGFWNDMNEPTIFYSEENVEKVFNSVEKYSRMNLDIYNFFTFKFSVTGLTNNEEDYKLFYHQTKEGTVRHDRVHNLYGYNMTRAAGEAFERLEPQKRILMFSRSAYIGMHRYGGMWTGDNVSWWSHILLSLRMMPSLNMCGFLYSGSDIGGFTGDVTEDLLLRWYALGIFTPLMRNHASMPTRRQEPYLFREKATLGNIISLRYILLPYIYSEYMKAALRDGMYFMPLSFVYPEDAFASQVEDELMVGESLLIAPVYEQNAKGRCVYLPEEMLEVRVKCGCENRMETKVTGAGHHYIPVALDEVVFFVRKNHVVCLSDGGQNVEQVDFKNLRLLGYAADGAEYEYYDDDGMSKDYDNPAHYAHLKIDASGKVECDNPGIRARFLS